MVTMVDIEAEICSLIRDRLSVPASPFIPDDRPPRMVQVRRTGGTSATTRGFLSDLMRDRAQLDFLAWGRTYAESMDLANEVRSLLYELVESQPLSMPVYEADETIAPRRDDDDESGAGIVPRVWFAWLIATRIGV